MRVALVLFLLLGACSDSSDVLEDLPNSSIAGAARENVPETRMEAGQSRPVTIGEDGPRLDACGALGKVSRVGPQGLALRAAPFADAKEVARLAEGDRAYVCARSIDQKWLGVVVIPAASPPADHAVGNVAAPGAEPVDCGLSSPVDRKQAYDGPCVSGWVASASISLVAE